MNSRVFFNLYRMGKELTKRSACREKLFTYSQLRQSRKFHTEDKLYSPESNKSTSAKNDLDIAVDSKFKLFEDQDAQIIYDVDEEQKIDIDEFYKVPEPRNPYEGINLKRGVYGVYDMKDLYEVLKKDNARDIFVASVPKSYAYVDYIVVTTAKSQKHMSALATFVRKIYKLKSNENDILPKIEGIKSTDWVALDLGNIALHIFSPKARTYYNLETLWTVGSKYDDQSNKPNVEQDLIERYNAFLAEFEPADS